MIDIHTHILPGLDDGADDIEETVAIVELLHSYGVRAVVATPHWIPGIYETSPQQIEEQAERVKAELAKREIQLEIYTGQEIHFDITILERLKRGELLTINHGSYFLLEFPFTGVPEFATEAVFRFRLAGYYPIIAHPERNERIQDDLEMLAKLKHCGALTQLTSGSILGTEGRRAEKTAHRSLKLGLADLIASDVHAVRTLGIELAAAVDVAAQFVGQENAKAMVSQRPEAILRGEPLE